MVFNHRWLRRWCRRTDWAKRLRCVCNQRRVHRQGWGGRIGDVVVLRGSTATDPTKPVCNSHPKEAGEQEKANTENIIPWRTDTHLCYVCALRRFFAFVRSGNFRAKLCALKKLQKRTKDECFCGCRRLHQRGKIHC